MFNIAVNNPFQWSTASGGNGLSLSAANSWFSVGIAITSLACNAYLMTYPPTFGNATTPLVHPSSLAEYLSLSAETIQQRGLAFLAGALCALTNVLQFEGGALAGFAAADMTKAFPLVATVWDIFVFGEFQNASRCVVVLLVLMYISYTLGMACLAGSISIE
jgi:glucose uptake protein GlcU